MTLPAAGSRRDLGLHLLVVLCLGLVLWGWSYGRWDLWGPDESRYTEVARELLADGDWFALTVHGQPYDEKPPFPFWVLAGMLWLSGGEVSSWSLRLPAIALAILTLELTYLIGRARLSARAGLLAAAVLATSPLFLREAPAVRLDMPLCAWVTLALWAWQGARDPDRLPAWRAAVLWLAVVGGAFVKGPIILIFLLPVLAGEGILRRSARPLRSLRPLAGLVFVAACVGGWLYLVQRAGGAGFVENQVAEQTVERFLSGSHQEPFYYYLLRLPVDIFLPWSIFLILALVHLWRRAEARREALRPLLVWGLFPLLVFSLAAGKRQMYLLPLLPALALLVGDYLDRQWLPRGVRRQRVVYGLLAVMIALGVALSGIVNPLLNPRKSAREFSGRLDAYLAAEGLPPEVGGVGKGDKTEYHVYGHYRIRPVHVSDGASPLPPTLVMRAREWPEAEPRLTQLGYRKAFEAEASSDLMVVVVREEP